MTANLGRLEQIELNSIEITTYETKGYDVVVEEAGFEPIGQIVLAGEVSSLETTTPQVFTGTFDGDSYIIKDLHVSQSMVNLSSPPTPAGLFSFIYQAEIKNLVFKNSTFYGTYFVGTFAGYS